MMARLYLKKTLTGFAPADEQSAELARKYNLGETYRADVCRPRETTSLRRYWALINLVLMNSDEFKTKEQLHAYLKIRAGHATPIVSKKTGEIFLVPNSIDFDTLDEAQFLDVWSKIIDVVCAEILPGVQASEMQYEIEKICGLQ